jgi:hypothetical protein
MGELKVAMNLDTEGKCTRTLKRSLWSGARCFRKTPWPAIVVLRNGLKPEEG